MAIRRGRLLGTGFDILVFVVGGVLLVADSWFASHSGAIRPSVFVAALVTVILGRLPVRIHGIGGEMEIIATPGVLVYLLLQAPVPTALALYVAALAAAELMSNRPWPSKLFNIGLGAIASNVTSAVLVGIGTPGANRLPLIAMVTAGSAYFAVDFALTWLSLTMFRPVKLGGLLADRAVWIGLGALLGACSIGYTAVLLVRLRWLDLLLVVPPVVTMFVASRAYDQANRHRSQLARLFSAAVRSHQAGSPEEIEQVLISQTGDVLHAPSVRLSHTPPGPGEQGIPVPALGNRYLVAVQRPAGGPYDATDLAAMATLVAVATESLDRARLAGRMAWLARRDPLTGLGNRVHLAEKLDQAIATKPASLCVFYLDLDGFKPVNDALGHAAGDALLVTISQRITALVGARDTAARVGGDEFVVLLPDGPAAQEAEAMRQRLAAVAAEPVTIGDHTVRVGASVGAALWRTGETVDDLLRRADQDMYARKHGATLARH